ncbi:unnamed protein product [Diatraea saccharalis]|uniref:Peroxisomal membrane protein 11C n=1 Tax=Diatraea saccharalis TaxID=40085 RepID=A0A9N9R150_9NEOP|nr:unnamed protein product [Diatraea saccharalis]
MDLVNEICDLLQCHVNRDKVVSLASYTLKLWGATAERKDLLTASARLASARATLRLFDDAAALKNMVTYGLGEKDGLFWGTLGVTNGVLTLAYLQAEKLVWLLDTGVLKLSTEAGDRVRIAHKLFWSLAAFLGFIRSLRALHLAAQVAQSPSRPLCAGARYSTARLTSTKLALDVVHAVSWLPRGWLWGGVLPQSRVAAAATASGVLALVIHYNTKRLTPPAK